MRLARALLLDFFASVIDPAVAAGGGHALAVVFHHDTYLVLGANRSEVKYGPGFHRPHAIWNGHGFYVSAGPILGVHDADGTLLETRTLLAGSVESTNKLALMTVLVNGQKRVGVMPLQPR